MKCSVRIVFALLALVAIALQFDVCGISAIIAQLLPGFQVGAGCLIATAIIAPFPVDPALTAIAVAYKNEAFIADKVFPRVPVGLQSFKYRKYAKADTFTIPETIVGRTSRPNQVDFGFTEETSSTLDCALDEPVPQADIDNAPAGYDPKARAAASVTDLVMLDREYRTAALAFNADQYASTNKATLSGTSQWSHSSSDPFKAVEDALDVVPMRPNVAVFGLAAWTAFKRHAAVIAKVLGSANSSGIVTAKMVADALELEEVLVGRGWYNSAKKGQTASLSRLWGDSCSLFFRDALADVRGRVTFGLTAQWGNRVAGAIPDPNIGMRGGVMVRAGESVKELITANDLGYLFSDCVA